MGGFAWVTLATNDSYSLGALVLANSLKQAGTAHQLVVLVTPGVTPSMRGKLSQVFDVVQEVNILDSQDKTNLKLLKRPELGITFTKLHCWRLTQYDKCVFLDADTLVLQNCDELFEREELSAAPDVGWPDCFNSGVFVYKPSNSTYENLIEFALDKGSFDGGDQGLLNLYFSDWAHKDISKHLPFIYNVCSTAFYSYLPAFKQYGKNAKIIHFIGNSKPWLLYFDSESKKVKPPSELYHITAILQLWWDIFCSKVHENLSREMTTSANMKIVTATSSNSQSYRPHTNTHIQIEEPISFHEPISYYQKNTHQDYHIPRSPSPPPTPQLNFHNVWDPWEEYLQDQDNSHANVDNKPTESHNTNADSRDDHNQLNEHIPATVQTEYLNNYVEQHNDQANDTYIPPISEQNSCNHFDEQTHCDYTDISNIEQIPLNTPDTSQPSSTYDIIQTSSSFDIISTPSECETEGQCEFIHDEEATEDAGLAGALAQMTLGVPRTAEQDALEDHYRKQCWELGNIDYLGKDSFDNIWQKICETLATGPAAGQEKPVEPIKQEPTVEKVEEKSAEGQ